MKNERTIAAIREVHLRLFRFGFTKRTVVSLTTPPEPIAVAFVKFLAPTFVFTLTEVLPLPPRFPKPEFEPGNVLMIPVVFIPAGKPTKEMIVPSTLLTPER